MMTFNDDSNDTGAVNCTKMSIGTSDHTNVILCIYKFYMSPNIYVTASQLVNTYQALV